MMMYNIEALHLRHSLSGIPSPDTVKYTALGKVQEVFPVADRCALPHLVAVKSGKAFGAYQCSTIVGVPYGIVLPVADLLVLSGTVWYHHSSVQYGTVLLWGAVVKF